MEEEFERALRLFGRDHIDLVRCHAVTPDDTRWKEHWTFAEKLFRYKEQGKIRAVVVPIHIQGGPSMVRSLRISYPSNDACPLCSFFDPPGFGSGA